MRFSKAYISLRSVVDVHVMAHEVLTLVAVTGDNLLASRALISSYVCFFFFLLSLVCLL